MKHCLKCLISYFDHFHFFATKHYKCARCGVLSADPSNLCVPIEQEFKP